MKLVTTATAGTMESNDIMVVVQPAEEGGIRVELTSSVMQQFGRQITAVIRQTAAECGVENAFISAVDKGALDCTVRARVTTALLRAADKVGIPLYTYEPKEEVRQDV